MAKKLLLLTFDKYFYYIEDYFNTTLNIFRIFSDSNFPGKGYDRRFVDNNSNPIVNGFFFGSIVSTSVESSIVVGEAGFKRFLWDKPSKRFSRIQRIGASVINKKIRDHLKKLFISKLSHF